MITTAVSVLQLLLAASESLVLLSSNYKQRFIWYSGMTVLCTWLLVTSLLNFRAQRSSRIVFGLRAGDPYSAESLLEDRVIPSGFISILFVLACVQLWTFLGLLYMCSTGIRVQTASNWDEAAAGRLFVKRVVIEDRLKICEELEKQMDALVNSYFCEWKEVIDNPERQRPYDREFDSERGQRRPADWPRDDDPPQQAPMPGTSVSPLDVTAHSFGELTTDEEDPEKTRWVNVGAIENLPADSGATVRIGDTQIGVFRFESIGKWYATQNMCPHKRAFLHSSGILGTSADLYPKVSCPNHKENFPLSTGACVSDPSTSRIVTFEVKVDDARVWVKVPNDLDEKLGTEKWIVKDREGRRERVMERDMSGCGVERGRGRVG
ncbi:hypothetical protein BJ742DRAFT_892143 [Cladochytrium replicatum]|nr:hypothetical protein BJ742DRAFT_892143 [Cladochytrium replicatum]